jgi:hypothetical protein
MHAASERTHNRTVFLEMGAADWPEIWQYLREDASAWDEGTVGMGVGLDGKHCGTDGRLYLEIRARVHVHAYFN